MTKIALIGSAPSSVRMAPYSDPSWSIWACSPGAYPHLQRVCAFFELHRREIDKPWFSKDYVGFLSRLTVPVYTAEHWPEFPTGELYPKDAMLEKFGPWFFTSSLSWMFALAIHQGASEIALYGVDMSAQEEWEGQRSGCHYFISVARAMGIKVHIPHESDLLRPPPLYGFREIDPMHVKLLCREGELKSQFQAAEAEMQAARDKYFFFKGALEDNTYQMKTWISDQTAIRLAYEQPKIESPDLMKPEPEDKRTTKVLIKSKRGNGAHPPVTQPVPEGA